jgi:hypothetical protein
VFENSLLRRIFGPKSDRRLEDTTQYEASQILHFTKCSKMITLRKIKWAGHVARMGVEEKFVQEFGRKTEEMARNGTILKAWTYTRMRRL